MQLEININTKKWVQFPLMKKKMVRGHFVAHWLILPLFLGICVSFSGCFILEDQKTVISISTTQKDITTPLLTVPAVNTPPSTTTPPAVLNPTSFPDSPAITSASSPMFGASSWCIASPDANWKALQNALNYACGQLGGANCTQIQPGGSCYYPNTLESHASYAFNDYYQKNPVPNSCNFRGVAIITSTNPSSGTCRFPSTSTSTSVLDTSNQNISTIFGAVVPAGGGGPSTSSSAAVLFKDFTYTTRTTTVYALAFLLLMHR